MKSRLAAVLVLSTASLWVSSLYAQEPAAPTAAMDTNHDGKVDNKETTAEIEKNVSVGDVVADVAGTVEAARDLKGKKEGKAALIMLFLGAIFKLLLSAVKLVKKQTNWFHAKKAKRILKYSTIALGALAALMSNLAFGMGWIEAGVILLSGPMAVAIHEYTKDSKDGNPDAS